MKEFFGAIASGDLESVKTLLAKDASLKNARNDDGISALQWSVYTFQPAVRDTLLAQGATLDPASACCVGDVDAVKSLVTRENVNVPSADGFPLLGLAAAFGGPECVSALIGLGADLNQKSTSLGGVAPVHASVFGRQTVSLKAILEAGADPNLQQEGGFTALMGAAQNGSTEAVDSLIAYGADKQAVNCDGKTAADIAEEAGHASLAQLLRAQSL